MKKWFLPLMAAALLLSGCGILNSETREERAAREAREARMVNDNLKAGDFRIDIDRMYPLRGGSKHVSNYSLSLKDGVLNSHLPYIGQAWRVPYGGGHALNFSAEIGGYDVVRTRNEGYEVRIYVKTDEDQHVYTLTVFDNGRASLDVQSQNRERISFSGIMDFYPPEE
ncbi:MAG: DUF4251 domain-containing protein [Bacteroidales bacterium]|jgi:hypothetical protein|nr:DUF4251 domain-containing protein [Bacteroidales bacterium]